MCGRFTLVHTIEELARIFAVRLWKLDLPPSFNIAPSQQTAVVLGGEGAHIFRTMQWGLVPAWAKDLNIGNRMINARSETAHEKPAFRTPFKRRRCIVPATGFYEWKKTRDAKVPYYITSETGKVLPLAGLWDRWESDRDTVMDTFTILTTHANRTVANIHDRMPVILDDSGWQAWLNTPPEKADTLHPLLKPFEEDQLRAYPVSRRVNNPSNNDVELLQEVGIGEPGKSPPGETPSLF